ncbi:MAG: cation transporter [Bryobacter sp.]|nr:cation transporter [Bryobacter sp.]
MGSSAIVTARGERLQWFTIAYNLAEAVIAIASGLVASSIALVGFGLDSLIELSSAGASLWRLRHGAATERRSLRIIGACFCLLAAYLAVESVHSLWTAERPETSLPGIALALASVVIMPWLTRAKRRVAGALQSATLQADSKQTEFCAWLSGILLAGLALNALFGWWWADPVAALVMVPIIAKEGSDALRGKTCCSSCGCH